MKLESLFTPSQDPNERKIQKVKNSHWAKTHKGRVLGIVNGHVRQTGSSTREVFQALADITEPGDQIDVREV